MQIDENKFSIAQVVPEIYAKTKFQNQLDVFFCYSLYLISAKMNVILPSLPL